MKYFQVLPEFDQQPLFKPSTRGRRIPNGYFLIKFELLTEKELERRNVPLHMVKEVDVNKSDIYHMFGARFKAGSYSRDGKEGGEI